MFNNFGFAILLNFACGALQVLFHVLATHLALFESTRPVLKKPENPENPEMEKSDPRNTKNPANLLNNVNGMKKYGLSLQVNLKGLWLG